MNSSDQRTLSAPVTLTGVGVHSGEEATLTLRPAEAGTGIRFRRLDVEGTPEIPADLDHVSDTQLGTTLGGGETKVRTVEHVMAALAASQIDNALLDMDGVEPPILDGSFLPYMEAIESVGAQEQGIPARLIRIGGPVSASGSEGGSYVAVPAESYRISATIDFEHPVIGHRYGSFEIDAAAFTREIAPARTFGFEADADRLREAGLARGASLENTVVLDAETVLNDGLRFPDEFLRHKVGDLVGDLFLLGGRLEGHVVADRPSHAGNVELARAIRNRMRLSDEKPIVSAQQIMQYLPHRYPMLLVDRIVEFESGVRIVGLKNVTINEPFFQGHYPGHPIMPGVLIIEAMAQVGGLLLMDAVENPEDKVVYFMSLDNVKWRRPVTPGDQIVFQVEMVQLRRHVCRMRGVGYVDEKVVAEADLMARIVDR